MKESKAYFASGCFWGTQYYFQKQHGVTKTTVGYSGGDVKNPKYEEVCNGKTGHVETVEVVFNPRIVSFEQLAKIFFETHDPTQKGGQGPDIGDQYRSVVFYLDEEQRKIAYELVLQLKNKGLDIATSIEQFKNFYPAEDYHQKYYKKTGGNPYCHRYVKRFDS